MKLFNAILVLTAVVVMSACSGISVKNDYDAKANFSEMKTYDWMPVSKKLQLSDLYVNRIKNAADVEMAAKGIIRSSDNPDFRIAIYFSVKDKLIITETGGFGYGYGYRGMYVSGNVHTQQYEEGTLILDFVDTTSDTMFWRGIATKKLKDNNSPQKRDQAVNQVVKKILDQYPPK